MKKWICSLMVVVCFSVFGFFGCSTPWQSKSTSGYLTATSLATTAENAVKPSCDTAAIPPDQCIQLQKIYGSIRAGLVAAGNTLVLSFAITDAVQQQALLQKYNDIMTAVQANVQDYINLFNTLQAKFGKKAMPYAISPELLAIIINAFMAIVQNIPSIITAISSFTLNTVDIAMLTTQIHAAQANLPVW